MLCPQPLPPSAALFLFPTRRGQIDSLPSFNSVNDAGPRKKNDTYQARLLCSPASAKSEKPARRGKKRVRVRRHRHPPPPHDARQHDDFPSAHRTTRCARAFVREGEGQSASGRGIPATGIRRRLLAGRACCAVPCRDYERGGFELRHGWIPRALHSLGSLRGLVGGS